MDPPAAVVVQVLVLVPVPLDELVVVELQLGAFSLPLDVLDHEHDDGEGVERQNEQDVHPESQMVDGMSTPVLFQGFYEFTEAGALPLAASVPRAN